MKNNSINEKTGFIDTPFFAGKKDQIFWKKKKERNEEKETQRGRNKNNKKQRKKKLIKHTWNECGTEKKRWNKLKRKDNFKKQAMYEWRMLNK